MTDIWDDKHRKMVWFIMLRMRLNTHTEVNPTVSNAFVYLQMYFNSNPAVEYDLYIIVISALMIAFKNEDLKFDIRLLFAIFLKVCNDYTQVYTPDEITSVFNIKSLEKRDISASEESNINNCEMDLLEAINFETHVDLPFHYINDSLLQFINTTDPTSTTEFYMDITILQEIVKNFELGVIKFFSAAEYLELPIPVIAAISLFYAIRGKPVPQETTNWIEETKKEFGQEACCKIASVYNRQNEYLRLYTRNPKKE